MPGDIKADQYPALSLLLPVKNGMEFLERCLIFHLACLTQDDEFLVVDDGSTDGSRELCDQLALVEPRMRVLANPGSGLVAALNYGLHQARSKWILRVDVDDFFEDERIALQRAEIDAGTAAIFCDYELVSRSNSSLGVIHSAVLEPAVTLSLVSGDRTPHPGVLFARDFAIAAGGYSQADFPAEDLGLWLRLAKVGTLKSVPKVLLHYVISAGSITMRNQINSRAKRSELIQNQSALVTAVNQMNSSWYKIWRSYAGFQATSRRRILLLRDWGRGIKLMGSSYPIQFFFFALIVLLDPRNILSLFHLSREANKRKRFRSDGAIFQ